MFEWRAPGDSLLDIALAHLTLTRVGLLQATLANPLPQPTLDLPHVAAAVNGLRAAGLMDHLPRGLLTAALYHFVRGEHDLAMKQLAEAQQIAERGPMPLFLADIHLTRARLAGSVKEEGGGMNVDAKAELAQAATLIRTLGYGRRYNELADAEAALEKKEKRESKSLDSEFYSPSSGENRAMDASISFSGVLTGDDAVALDELAEALAQDAIASQPVKAPPKPGQKAALTAGIAIPKLILSGVGSLISVLNFWQKTRPKYKVTINRGDVKIEVENLSAVDLQEAVKAMNAAAAATTTTIVIATK